MAKSTRRTAKILNMPEPVSTTLALSEEPASTEADIAKRAFELYCTRGCQHGSDVDDWLRAERELQMAANSAGSRSFAFGQLDSVG
jgi:hypothetical protein